MATSGIRARHVRIINDARSCSLSQRERAGVRILRTKSSRLEPMNLPDAGSATTLSVPTIRVAAIPSPGGEGQGEGGLPSLQFVPALSCHRFMGRESA